MMNDLLIQLIKDLKAEALTDGTPSDFDFTAVVLDGNDDAVYYGVSGTLVKTPILTGDTTPDFTLVLVPITNTVNGASESVDTRVMITEVDGVASDGVTDIKVNISHDDRLVLTYDPNATEFNGAPVNNADWTLSEPNPFTYRFTYNGGVFPANGQSFIGLDMVFNPQSGTVGEQDIVANITTGSGGEDHPSNNSDLFTIVFNNT